MRGCRGKYVHGLEIFEGGRQIEDDNHENNDVNQFILNKYVHIYVF